MRYRLPPTYSSVPNKRRKAHGLHHAVVRFSCEPNPEISKAKKKRLEPLVQDARQPSPRTADYMVDTSGNPSGCKCHFSNGSLSAVITA
jgi:hypothetical protein